MDTTATISNESSLEHSSTIADPSLNDRLSVSLPSLNQIERKTSGKISYLNASELGRKGAEARTRNLALKEAALKEAKELKAKIAAQPDATVYANTRLLRVRGQLDALDEAIQQEVAGGESKRLKELVEAQAKLSEQERILAGRPLPGSHRPSSPKRTKDQPQSYEPVE